MVDENKKSNFTRNIIIAFIIAILFWQYGIPFIDETVKLPSQHITDFLYGDDVKPKWQIYVLDKITGNETIYTLSGVQLGAIYQMQSFKQYEIGLIHNQNGHLFGTYKFMFTIETSSNNATGEIYPFSFQIPAYQFWGSNRIPIPAETYNPDWQRSDSLNIQFVDNNGSYIQYKDVDKTTFQLVMERVI